MSGTMTVDDIWKLFEETNRQFREQSAETDRKLREQSAETDRKIQETAAEVRETAAQMREQHAETERVVREVSRKVGDHGGRWGDFVEGLVAPACENLFAERGIPIHTVSRQVKSKLPGGRHMEIDMLVVNTDAVALVEVKSTLTVEDVRDHLARLAEFKDFFPVYADRRVFGAVAGIVISENADRFAMNNGLFVMVQSGESMRTANEPEFQPRSW